jgi:uncharacterized protein (DUF2141 family)
MRVMVAVVLVSALSGAPRLTAQPPQHLPTQPTVRLRIEVVDVRAKKGQLIFGVFKSADGFPKEEKKSLNWQVVAADTKTMVFECDLPPGRYGASVLHDENGNGDMDTNLVGIPTEGYGVTNNPKPKYRAATFKESQFELPAQGVTMKISIQYF